MYYQIMEIDSGMYICTNNIKVVYSQFARHFATIKQAKAFMKSIGADDDTCVIELVEDEEEETEEKNKV